MPWFVSRRALLALFCLLSFVPRADAGDRGEYRVTVSADRRRLLRVEADLELQSRWLLFSPAGAESVQKGWAHWIDGLEVTDARGRVIPLERRARGVWRLTRRVRQVHVKYDLRLDHDKQKWPFGLDEATYLREDCTYLATSAVFLGPPELEHAVVRFDLPEGWIVSTAWDPVPVGDAGSEPGRTEERYVVRGFEELTHACLLVGEHKELRLHAAGVEVLIATGAELTPSLPRIRETLEAALYEATILFGGDAPTQRFVVIANMADYSGGSGHVGGMSMVFERAPTERDTTWAHVALHELLHMWIGVSMRRADSSAEWFNEGVTDYLAVMLLARAGIASEETLFETLADTYERYARHAGRRSLASAGADKARETALVYAGGLYMGLLLDVEIRSGSLGRRSIEDLLRLLYAEFGNSGETYTTLELSGIASDLADRDVGKLFDRYVDGELRIPVESYLRRLGLGLEAKGGRIAPHPAGTEAQGFLRMAIFGS